MIPARASFSTRQLGATFEAELAIFRTRVMSELAGRGAAGIVRSESFAPEMGHRRHVRFICDSDRTGNVLAWRHEAIG
jgi:hypothetical protein